MLKRRHYVALGLMGLVTLLVLNLPSQTALRLKLAVGAWFLPLFGLSGAIQQGAADLPDAITPRRELIRQNQRLRRENQQLRLRALQGDEGLRENNRLRQLLGWQQQTGWKLRLARVVARDPAAWWRTAQIDLGSRDGLAANYPVLTPEGLVGRVAAVGLTQSQVVLVGDPACRVAALVENAQRDHGIVVPGSALDPGVASLVYLPRDAEIQPGQRVVTSGLGGIFPKGVVVGTIVDARPAELGLYTEARVRLAAPLGALEEVWVLFP